MVELLNKRSMADVVQDAIQKAQEITGVAGGDHLSHPTQDLFDDHDTPAQVAQKLQVEKKARAEARDNRPLAVDPNLDGPQREIVSHYESALEGLKRSVLQRLHQFAVTRTATDLGTRAVALEGNMSIANSECDRTIAAASETMWGALAEARRRYAELKGFKSDNKLDRDAIYPNSPPVAAMVLLPAVVIEAMINFLLLIRADVLNLLEAVVQSSLFAFINMSFSWFVGYFVIRNVWHVKLMRRIPAIILAVLAGLGAVFYNLSLAVYRAVVGLQGEMLRDERSLDTPLTRLLNMQFERTPDGVGFVTSLGGEPVGAFFKILQAAKALLQSVLVRATPTEFDALLVFLVGMIFAGFALRKGITFSDPYPGYERFHRDWVRAQRAQDNLKAASQALISKSWLETQLYVRDRLEKAHADLENFNRAIQGAREVEKYYRLNARQLELNCNAVLRMYRDANAAVRDPDIDVPAYFHDWYSLRKELDFPPLEEDGRRYLKLMADMKERVAEADVVQRKIREANQAQLDRLAEAFRSVEYRLRAKMEGKKKP